MAVDSANIGANFSQYTGDPGLGGFGLTQGRVDTRALEDLARYTMLYNKAEYDQKQKDAEKIAEEIAKMTAIDLSTTIPKDAKILQEKFDSLSQYLRDNPDALNYKNRQQWLEYNKRKNDLTNDIKFATIRSVLNVSRKNQIAEEKNEEIKKFLEAGLQKNIEETDIRTPLDHAQKYDLSVPEIPDNKGIEIDVTKAGPNQIFQRTPTLFDVQEAKRNGFNYSLGMASIDPSTTGGTMRLMKAKENIWIKQAELFNQALASAKDANGNVDPNQMNGIPFMDNINAYNAYIKQTREDIKNGSYTDKFGSKLSFGQGPLREEDYQEINVNDGLSPAEMAVVAQFSKWAGDSQKTKVIQTDDAIQRANLAAEWERIGISRAQLNKGSNEDLVSATAVLREAADVLKAGVPRGLKGPDGKTTTVRVISDPNLLREFGAIDKDGNVTNVPDVVYYNEEENKLQLGYYKRKPDKEGNLILATNEKGETPLDRSVDMSGTQWLGQIVKRKNPNKDIGGVNMFIEQFFNTKEVGRQLKNINKIYGTTVEGTTGKSESESQSRTTPAAASGGKDRWSQFEEK